MGDAQGSAMEINHPPMNTHETQKILVVDSRDNLREKVCQLILSRGFEVAHFKSPEEAIASIETRSPFSYALILSGYRMPVMTGDEFLKKAGTILPGTPRILLTDSEDIYSIINTVNAAGIHSCITVPFDDEVFLREIDRGIDQFRAVLKRHTLERVTESQNQKMYLLANKLRKLETDTEQLINEREKKIRLLRAKTAHQQAPVTLLETYIRLSETALSAEGMHGTFFFMKDVIKQLLEKVSAENLDLKAISEEEIRGFTLPRALYSDLSRRMLPLFLEWINATHLSGKDPVFENNSGMPREHIGLSFSEGNTRATIRSRTNDPRILNLSYIKKLLEQNGVTTGIKNDHLIELWISCASPEREAFVIAEGKEPAPPRHAEIIYHFPVDGASAGGLKSDGSIDFCERGETPFVLKNALLAEKRPALNGSPGLDVFGNVTPAGDATDKSMGAGSGARISLDGLKIYADIDGQPYLDTLGDISVFPELRINGDVDYKTGNIRFDGNIFVKGTVKHGFTVTGASLTVEHISGARSIDLTGDLNVVSGIVDTPHIMVMGSIHARYINNSTLHTLGNLVVQKEIIGSTIRTSGTLINEAGKIIASDIAAKRGVSAGTVGTEVSAPSTITVGVDVYLKSLIERIDEKIAQTEATINEIMTDIFNLEKSHDELHETLCGHANTQDGCHNKTSYLKNKIAELLSCGNLEELERYTLALKALEAKAQEAERAINACFEQQDRIDGKIVKNRGVIEDVGRTRETLLDERKKWVALLEKDKPLAEVKISKNMMAGTKINASHATIVLSNPIARCRIVEARKTGAEGRGGGGYEMRVIRY